MVLNCSKIYESISDIIQRIIIIVTRKGYLIINQCLRYFDIEGDLLKDINELIGIITSIDYDEVINDREINYLKEWTDLNRNLVVNHTQEKIIELIDLVLEDNVLTKEEKTNLLSECMTVKSNIDSLNPSLYELTGIIEGITSDRVINDKEIENLKKWVLDNQYIREYATYKPLCTAIDLILENNVITMEEQNELLNTLNKMINNSNFNNRLSKLYELVKKGKNIGIELIDILYDYDTANKIHEMAIAQLKHTLNSYSCSVVNDPIIVFISLTLIGMLSYDGDYYSNVSDTYSELYDMYSEQRIENLIRNVLRKFVDEKYLSYDGRVINVALRNAIVPSPFLAHFFEFIFDIYKLNFEYELSDDLYGDFKFIFEGLNSVMLEDNDDVSVKVTKKTYKLIKTSKQLVADPTQIDAIIDLSIMVIRIIDEHIWEQEANIQNEYFKEGYKTWCSTLEKKELERRNGLHKTSHVSWEPDFRLIKREVFLVPPVHKIKDEYDWSTIRAEVIADGEVRRNIDKPNIQEIIGGLKITIEPMRLHKPLNEVKYRLMSGDTIIYDSEDKLFRDIIVFDSEGKEIKNNMDYGGTVAICHNEDIIADEYYRLEYKNVSIGDTLVYGNNVLNFSKSISDGIVGETWNSCYVNSEKSNGYIKVFKKFEYLMFECENTFEKFVITVDGINRKLSSFEYSVINRSNFNRYILNLSEFGSGIHTFVVNTIVDGKMLKVFSETAVLDNELDYDIKIKNSEICDAQISSSLFDGTMYKNIYKCDDVEKVFEFDYEGNHYFYLLPMSFDLYSLTNSDLKKHSEEIWIGDIIQDSCLTLYGNYSRIYLKTLDGKIIKKELAFESKYNKASVQIGFIQSYKNEFDALLICAEDIYGIESQIMCVLRCFINDVNLDIRFDPTLKELNVITSYFGNGKIFFEVKDSKDNVAFSSDVLADKEPCTVEGLKSFEKYSIIFYEKSFGLSFQKKRLLKSYEKFFYAWEDFTDKTFKIVEAICEDYSSFPLKKKKYRFDKSYITFNYLHDDGKFSAELFVRTNTTEFMLDRINPVTVEICGETINKCIELAIDSYSGDALMIDEKHHGILNDNEDTKALPIFSYYIDVLED